MDVVRLIKFGVDRMAFPEPAIGFIKLAGIDQLTFKNGVDKLNVVAIVFDAREYP